MKSFERLVLAHLKDITGPLLDPLQFAYRENRSVDDAWDCTTSCNTLTPQGLMQGSCLWTSVRRSIPSSQISSSPNSPSSTVPAPTCQWISNFLTDRRQQVRLGSITSSTQTISTGAPRDDTTVISLIWDGDESAYRREVEQLALWCGQNNLELNTLKTVEDDSGLQKEPPNTAPPFHSQQHGVCCGNFQPPNRTGTDYNGQSGLQRKSSVPAMPSIQDLYVSIVRKRA
ncbi:hypothetical protein L3Q82_010820, partial [Scortum barcoo]